MSQLLYKEELIDLFTSEIVEIRTGINLIYKAEIKITYYNL